MDEHCRKSCHICSSRDPRYTGTFLIWWSFMKYVMIHVIGFFDLVDLWVIKIKKSLWSFALVVRRDHVNRARNTDHAVRTRERFVYSIAKITRFYDYQTWQTYLSRSSRGAQRFVGFFLIMLFGCWLARQENSDHMGSWVPETSKIDYKKFDNNRHLYGHKNCPKNKRLTSILNTEKAKKTCRYAK